MAKSASFPNIYLTELVRKYNKIDQGLNELIEIPQKALNEFILPND